jgi:hypothetical protein
MALKAPSDLVIASGVKRSEAIHFIVTANELPRRADARLAMTGVEEKLPRLGV